LKEVYLLKSDTSGYYKIGVSNNSKKRVKQLETGSSENIDIVHIFNSDLPFKLEKALHNFFISYKINREWYDLPIDIHFDFIEICEKIEKNLKLIIENN
jgi:hypothetical protein